MSTSEILNWQVLTFWEEEVWAEVALQQQGQRQATVVQGREQSGASQDLEG